LTLKLEAVTYGQTDKVQTLAFFLKKNALKRRRFFKQTAACGFYDSKKTRTKMLRQKQEKRKNQKKYVVF
jgi:hypothetical protein